MKKSLRATGFGICVMTVCLYGRAQHAGGASQITQLVADVQQAAPKAALSEGQRAKLQSNLNGIKSTMLLRQQGQPVDRQKLMSLLDEVHTLVDSGAFAKNDRIALDKEFDSLQRR